jgi:hypothetical protein
LAVFLAARVGDFEFVIDTEHDVAKFVDGDTAHVVMAVVAEFVAEVM